VVHADKYKLSSKQEIMPTHDDLLISTKRIEGSILNAVTSSSGSIENEIKILAEQLESTNLDSLQQTVAEFLSTNRKTLENMSGKLDAIVIQHKNLQAIADERQVVDAQQKILDSLRFTLMQERRHQIHRAHKETYQWILQPMSNQSQSRDNFTSWLASSEDNRRIFWIYGKAGCGKSTLMRFIDEKISNLTSMFPWAQDGTVVRAQYFFWNPGHKLQKSLSGLLRSLLVQLLEQMPDLIPQVFSLGRWKAARTTGNNSIDWTESELKSALHESILCIRKSTKVFLLVDGMDELEGSDETREELIDLLKELGSLEDVKICLSSRPWNIFWDAFSSFPQLRLEDLTQNDIKSYVQAQLHSQVRFQYLLKHDQSSAESLIIAITRKAAGVFLWVRLVVRELLKGLRDGDSIHLLWVKLEQIPADLNDYFTRFMNSISHNYRREASAMLQIALYEEDDFQTAHPLRLIDLSFSEEEAPDFALTGHYSFEDVDFADLEALQFRLDSTVRRLNSRCMGLLECQYQNTYLKDSMVEDSEDDDEDSAGQGFQPRIQPKIFAGPDLLPIFNVTVDFLHRSCRDFFLAPETQSQLYQYTQGPYDVRKFLRNSRLVQFMALSRAGENGDLSVGMASYLLSSLSLQSCRHTSSSAIAATIMEPVIENLVNYYDNSERFWYISPVLASWQEEGSSFLTLAIDFELSFYVEAYMTSQSIHKKLGRPILDYILRPRFAGSSSHMNIGNLRPNLKLLGAVLKFGADPNEKYGVGSVWAMFLCFLADTFAAFTDKEIAMDEMEYFGAMEMLICKGAVPLLPKSWLTEKSHYEYLPYVETDVADSHGELFSYRWPMALPVTEGLDNNGSEPWFAVSNLLEQFRPYFGSGVDKLVEKLQN
jgi:hypothetical protein